MRYWQLALILAATWLAFRNDKMTRFLAIGGLLLALPFIA